MGWKIFFSFLFIIFAVSLLFFYWFVPFKTIEFKAKPSNSNFSLNSYKTEDMQFYKNMRYPDSKISYKIDDCTLQKKDDMERAFEIISNMSVLNFYSINNNEEISITCDSKSRMEEGLFIAGEGGPTNITQTENFNVILHGKVLLIRESKCDKPNIALHELLHTLGFNHSSNSNNIMYPVSNCKQTIGQDIIDMIDELYSVPSYSDLTFENVSAIMHGRYLDINISTRNIGLKNSEKAKIVIYIDKRIVKEINLDTIEIGYGRTIMLSNVWIKKINFNELELFINSSFNELDKNNNKIILEIKK
jgi:hypothetical protein